MREKDSNSDLNSFDDRKQEVIVANFYWQDFLWKGYTAQWSLHANLDHGGTHYDRNGNIVRPAPIGTVRGPRRECLLLRLGWRRAHRPVEHYHTRFTRSSATMGSTASPDVPVTSMRQMAAVELSYDRDWIRYKASLFYASGDGDTEDGYGDRL